MNADHKNNLKNQMDAKARSPVKPIRRWQLTDILGAAREATIEHNGMEYRLRITSNAKLILTKRETP